MSQLVLFLPAHDVPWRWLRIAGQVVAGRGEGFPAIAEDERDLPVVIAPADAVTLHWAELPDRSQAQSVAAARLLAADASAAPIGELHVAVGREGVHAERPIGVVAAAQMQAWLVNLAANGVDPAALLPAPMLLPRPEGGYLRADLGGESVVRGPTSGFADEALLTELVTGGTAPDLLTRDDLEAAIVAAVADPALDLRQGSFARRRRVGIDWALVRRIAWLALGLLTVSLLISLVQIVRYNAAADTLELRAEQLARSGLPSGETVSNADRQLGERLSRLRGGGLGFTRTAAAVLAAVRGVPGTEVRTLSFDPAGAMRVTVATRNEGQIVDLQRRIAAAGLVATPMGQFTSSGGRMTGDIMVKPQ